MGKARSMQEEKMHIFTVYIVNPEGKRSFVKLTRRGEDNIKMYPKRNGAGKCPLDICGSESDHWRAFVNTTMEI